MVGVTVRYHVLSFRLGFSQVGLIDWVQPDLVSVGLVTLSVCGRGILRAQVPYVSRM